MFETSKVGLLLKKCGRKRSWHSFRVVECYRGTESNHEHLKVACKGRFVTVLALKTNADVGS
jgi:hypothetical protein